MEYFHYSHRKAISLAIAIVIMLILFPALFRIIFAAEDEISYSASAGISTCDEFYIREESERTRCTSSYTISLGNTGTNHQQQISIDLRSVPTERRLSWNLLDIVATNRKAIGPSISNQQLGDTLRFEIQDLQPNRLVEITILSQGAEHARQMQDIDIRVHAEGTVVQSNPRLTVSLRFLRNLTGIFGF